ncbi:DEAD/DEAH box helicase [Actinomyces provencensis]|uniref:DEAD/DEAH box helicase n=1 Tax=Actinomyces provencensis TaxID=1720198 RepID=UPI00096AC13F|nr:DEAD/DEAH box helicase [Actinomyces provencensis]
MTQPTEPPSSEFVPTTLSMPTLPFTPTLPSLLAEEVQDALTEYLTTTYALGDQDTREQLGRFLRDPETGIFRGPYYRLRLPFRAAPAEWRNPLGWLPDGFVPHAHQAAAFERLTSLGHEPQPTLVTTGTGSGKTESFLLPLLDHARRAAAEGAPGITALVMYPMNALVTDQARRIAQYVASSPELSDIRVGLYIGGNGRNRAMSADHVIDHREELRSHPPQILLTNYKMLDLLLLDPRHRGLWAGAAESLQYLVLDEFHTYDGAQGSDVAMLLRRLGLALGIAEEGRPLGRITPVATSATLGDAGDTAPMRELARTVFGCDFPPDCVITERRRTPEEFLPPDDEGSHDLVPPRPEALADLPAPESEVPESWVPLVQCVFGGRAPEAMTDGRPDPVLVGRLLAKHPMTRLLLEAIGTHPAAPDTVLRTLQVRTLNLFPWYSDDPAAQARNIQALDRLLALYSFARVQTPRGLRSFLEVQVQLWVRDVSHLLRAVDESPQFSWEVGAAREPETHFLPAAYCRACGASGWMSMVQEASDSLEAGAGEIWRSALDPRGRSRIRVLMTGGETSDCRYLDADTLELFGPSTPAREREEKHLVRVHVPVTGDDAKRETCPACGSRDSVRFVGTSAATLLSVCLTQEFGSTHLPRGEKKTLVFTDSVQDAAHRAAFIEARAFTFNLRGALVRKLGELGGAATLTDLADSLGRGEADKGRLPDEDLYLVTPPDFIRRRNWDGEWLARDRGGSRHKKLAERLVQEAHLEAGLNSRIGRTLLMTGTWSLDLDVDVRELAEEMAEAHRNSQGFLPDSNTGERTGTRAYAVWIYGVLSHLREAGGISHGYLTRLRQGNLARWHVGGGARGTDMRRFGPGRPAPGFLSAGRVAQDGGRETDEIPLSGTARTWLGDWTRKCLADTGAGVGRLLGDLAEACTRRGLLDRVSMRNGGVNFGLLPDRIVVSLEEPVRLACSDCDHVEIAAPGRVALWEGAPCPRMRCEGTLSIATEARPEGRFYRQLYRQGIRRIIAREHTALLEREEREDLERSFIQHTSPVDPNVLACTPTLELGVDIGDLSTVALASLPRTSANYLQRVGRAGRSDGNAFVLTAVHVRPSTEQRFENPLDLIDGPVRPPAAYLRATELVRRQFLASVLDRASRTGELGTAPGLYPELMRQGLEEGTWMRRLVDLVRADGPALVDGFLSAFPPEARDSRASLLTYASDELEGQCQDLIDRWQAKRRTLRARIDEVSRTVKDLEDRGHLDDSEKNDLDRCRGEVRGLVLQSERHNGTSRSQDPEELFTSMAREGLLPTYNLVDDGTDLEAHLWWRAEDDSTTAKPEALDLTYSRPAETALTELAPGSWFYAGGRRLQVDAVERGIIGDDAPTMRAICPECGWLGDLTDACPHCGSVGVAEVGQHAVTMPLKAVSSQANLDDTTISDQQDERVRTRYLTATSVVAEDVTRAWRSTRTTFGAEMLARATIRRYNLGRPASGGRRVRIAGAEYSAPGFEVCAGCGVVREREEAEDRVRHRGYCPSRRGVETDYDTMYFTHALQTQAVRILLPELAAVDEGERIAFQAALQLGVREDFGGDPHHLTVHSTVESREEGPRAYLVLADTVPGGTGYLDRYADPAALREILEKARTVLENCTCNETGQDGCHHCVLGVVGDADLGSASRDRSLSAIEALLDDWETEDIDSLEDIDIEQHPESVLEAHFMDYLQQWTEAHRGRFTRARGAGGFRNGHLTIEVDGKVRKWDVRAQGHAGSGSLRTVPDYRLSRPDVPGSPTIEVYLDGQRYHADIGDTNRTADDARKRAGLRADRKLVWSLSWDDVDSALTRLTNPAKAEDGVWLPATTRAKVAAALPDDAGKVSALAGGSLELLTTILADPDSSFWGRSALALAKVLMMTGRGTNAVRPVPVAHSRVQAMVDAMVRETLGFDAVPVPRGTVADSMVAPTQGPTGLPVWVLSGVVPAEIDEHLGILTVLDDRDGVSGGEHHLAQWQDWLRLSNILQMLVVTPDGGGHTGRYFGAWTAESLADFESQDLPLTHLGEQPVVALAGVGHPGREDAVEPVPAPAPFPAQPAKAAPGGAGPSSSMVGPDPAWDEALELCVPVMRPFLEDLRAAGLPAPVVGEELESGETFFPIEAQWDVGGVLVALSPEPDTQRDEALVAAGFTVLDLGMGVERAIAALQQEGAGQ